jgi:hypothetical protein
LKGKLRKLKATYASRAILSFSCLCDNALTKGIARDVLAFRQHDLTKEVRIGSSSISVVTPLARNELRYVLNPQEVYGSDFPAETFRVLTKSSSWGEGEGNRKRIWTLRSRARRFVSEKRGGS